MEELRSEFPVLERVAYLNAGTNGPVPRTAVAAARDALREQAEVGRDRRFMEEWLMPRLAELRARVAGLLGCDADELALTGSTTDGINTVLLALELGPGDEVLTSDEEHPGLLAPLATGRARRGFEVRVVPFDELAGEVGARTRLVACSHVSWVSGRVLDADALAGAGVPLLLDGAQGLGALPVDVRALGCDFYAASAQKWLCGPLGLGYLYVRRERIAQLSAPCPGYGSLAAPERPLDLELHPSARRFEGGVAPEQASWALAALDVLSAAGLARVLERGPSLAGELARRLRARGFEVSPRGASTLVSWRASEPEAEAGRLRDAGFVLRFIPGRRWLRASVGAWSSDEELERLVDAA